MDPVPAVQQALERLPVVRLAVLFGSRAQGKAHARSDLDLGLLLEPVPPAQRQAIEVEIARVCKVPADFVDLASAPPQLRFEIARSGMVLVEREMGAWVTFKARAMIDWWDWAPYARRIHQAAIQHLREKVRNGSA